MEICIGEGEGGSGRDEGGEGGDGGKTQETDGQRETYMKEID